MLSGTISISPVGSLRFLLLRSRTTPVTEMVDSQFNDFTTDMTASLFSTTSWVVP